MKKLFNFIGYRLWESLEGTKLDTYCTLQFKDDWVCYQIFGITISKEYLNWL